MRWWWLIMCIICAITLIRLRELSLLPEAQMSRLTPPAAPSNSLIASSDSEAPISSPQVKIEDKEHPLAAPDFPAQLIEPEIPSLEGDAQFHIIILVKDRVNTFRKTLTRVMNANSIEEARITVFQNKDNKEIREIIESYPRIKRVQHSLSGVSRIYMQVLKDAWNLYPEIDYLIVLEDDLLVSPDFFEYFKALAPILEQDPTIFSIRGWTDHGFPWSTNISNPSGVYHSEIFVGLGWMMHRKTYLNHIRDLPKKYVWDMFFQEISLEKGMTNLYPEVPRIYHYFDNKKGATTSKTRQLVQYENMILNQEQHVDFGNIQRFLRKNYLEEVLWPMVRAGKIVDDLSKIPQYENEYLIVYHDAGPITGLQHKARAASSWGSRLDYFAILLPNGYSRNQYAEMVHFKYGKNRILVIGKGSPFEEYLEKERGAKPLTSSDFENPMDWNIPLPFPEDQIHVGEEGESCDQVCGNIGKKCDLFALAFLNTCPILHKYFPECGYPCKYVGVSDRGIIPEHFEHPSYQQNSYSCFTTATRNLNCTGAAVGSTRICVCT